MHVCVWVWGKVGGGVEATEGYQNNVWWRLVFCQLVKPCCLYPSIPPAPSPLPPKVRVTVLSSTFACVSVSDVSSTCWREKGWKTASPCHLLWNLVTCCHKPAPSRVCVCLIKWSRLSHAPPKGLAQVCPNASSPQHLSKDTSNQCYSFNHSVNGGREGLWQSVGRGQHLFTVMDFWEFTSAIAGFCNAC